MSAPHRAPKSVSTWRIPIYVLIVMVAISIPDLLHMPVWVALAAGPLAAGAAFYLVVIRRS